MVLMCAGGIVLGTALGLVHIRYKRNALQFESEGHTATCFEMCVGSRLMSGAPNYQRLDGNDPGDDYRSADDDVIIGWQEGVMNGINELDDNGGQTALVTALRGVGDDQSLSSQTYSRMQPVYDDMGGDDMLLTMNPTFSKQPTLPTPGGEQYRSPAHTLHPAQRSITPPYQAYTTLPVSTEADMADFNEFGGVYA